MPNKDNPSAPDGATSSATGAYHREEADARTAALGPGSAQAYDSACAQMRCSGDLPSEYLFEALGAAVAVERAELMEHEAEAARRSERMAIFDMLGGDTHSRAFNPPTQQEISDHVKWLEARAREQGRRDGASLESSVADGKPPS